MSPSTGVLGIPATLLIEPPGADVAVHGSPTRAAAGASHPVWSFVVPSDCRARTCVNEITISNLILSPFTVIPFFTPLYCLASPLPLPPHTHTHTHTLFYVEVLLGGAFGPTIIPFTGREYRVLSHNYPLPVPLLMLASEEPLPPDGDSESPISKTRMPLSANLCSTRPSPSRTRAVYCACLATCLLTLVNDLINSILPATHDKWLSGHIYYF